MRLRLADHPRANDEEVVEHEGGIHLVTHIGLVTIFRVHRHIFDAGSQLVDERRAVEAFKHLARHHPGLGLGLEATERLAQLGRRGHALLLIPNERHIGLEGGQVLEVIPFRLRLVEVELELVAQPLVDLGGVLLAHVTSLAVSDEIDPFGQALHEVVGALVGSVLARGLDPDTARHTSLAEQGRQPLGQAGRQQGMFLLADRREQAIAQLPVGCGDRVHLGAELLTQIGQGPLPGSRIPDLLGQHVILGAGQGTGAMSGNQFGEDGGEADWRHFITVRILASDIDSLGTVLVVGPVAEEESLSELQPVSSVMARPAESARVREERRNIVILEPY